MNWLCTLSALPLVLAILYACSLWQARRAEKRYPPEGEFITVEGLRVHFVRHGSGQAVVMLHGSDGSLQDYTSTIFQRVAERYKAIALDRPGHGYSEPVRQAIPTPQVQAQLLHRTLQSLQIETPILVAHSWSGALALAYALAYPDEVRGIVLLGAWVYGTESSLLLRLAQWPVLGDLLLSTVLAVVKRPIIQRSLEEAFSPTPVPAEYAEMAKTLWLRRADQGRAFAQENTLNSEEIPELSQRYPEIRVPVAILTGDADQVVDPARHAIPLHVALPASTLNVLPGAGHEIAFTHPEAVLLAIEQVCRRAEQEK